MKARLSRPAWLALLIVLSVRTSSAAAAPTVYEIDPGHSDVSFRIRHLVTKVRGHFTRFSGTITIDAENPPASAVTLTIQVSSVDTANSERDQHLLTDDFFAAERFPTLCFESTRTVRTGENAYDVAGNLTMRGVTKEVVLSVTSLGEMVGLGGEVRAGFSAQTRLDRKAFGISWNASLDRGGFVLGDEVEIEISVEAIRQGAEANE